MRSQSWVIADMFAVLSRNWRQILLCAFPFMLLYAGILVLEGIAIARMDRWLPVDTMETATRYSAMISAVSLWLRLCTVGAGVIRVLKILSVDGVSPRAGRFLGFWAAVSLALTVSLLVVDMWRGGLQFRDPPLGDDTLRWFWLATVYTQVALYYLAARLLFGASPVGCGARSWTGAWTATTTLRSFGLFLVLLILKLTIENVFVTVLSYVPFVAPFWFIPNELSELRYFVSQGTRIGAESVGVLFYLAFWGALDRHVVEPRKKEAP